MSIRLHNNGFWSVYNADGQAIISCASFERAYELIKELA
jgi:hypothetical protein